MSKEQVVNCETCRYSDQGPDVVPCNACPQMGVKFSCWEPKEKDDE